METGEFRTWRNVLAEDRETVKRSETVWLLRVSPLDTRYRNGEGEIVFVSLRV